MNSTPIPPEPPKPEEPSFHYSHPVEVSPAPRAHAPAVLLLLVLLVTAVVGLTAVFVYPLRYGKARAKQASEANAAAYLCGSCAQTLLDEMDKDGTLHEGKYILSSIPGKEEKNVPPAMQGLHDTLDERLHETAYAGHDYLVVVEGRTVTYAAAELDVIGTYPETSQTYGIKAYAEEYRVNRSKFESFAKFYDYTFEAVFTPAKYKEN